MAKSKWVIEECGYILRIQWYDAEECDLGAYFGDGGTPLTGHFKVDADDDGWVLAHNLGCDALIRAGIGTLGRMGFEFETYAEAKRGLALVNAVAKAAKDSRPWPQWALQARAAGWKPPKGWKP